MTASPNANALPAHAPEQSTSLYRGRFAPSPTGPLHVGSLVAAVASYLEARTRGGHWLLRMEDLDRPRCTVAAAAAIERTLAAYGFEHDGPVVWQSRRTERYDEVFAALRRQDLLFPCACSRRELADSLIAPDGASIYPGTCRHGLAEGRSGRAWRVRVPASTMTFVDDIQGDSHTDLANAVGDFVVRRADGLYAYQLAVVIDDADAGITDIVRGADLFASTPRQIYLQQLLGLETPRYAHVPVATNRQGEKLSKQTLALPLDDARPVPAMLAALKFLGQEPPEELRRATLHEVWQWALAHWQLARVRRAPAHPWEAPDAN